MMSVLNVTTGMPIFSLSVLMRSRTSVFASGMSASPSMCSVVTSSSMSVSWCCTSMSCITRTMTVIFGISSRSEKLLNSSQSICTNAECPECSTTPIFHCRVCCMTSRFEI